MVPSKYQEGSYGMVSEFPLSGARLRSDEDKFNLLYISFGRYSDPAKVPLISCLVMGQLVLGF